MGVLMVYDDEMRLIDPETEHSASDEKHKEFFYRHLQRIALK